MEALRELPTTMRMIQKIISKQQAAQDAHESRVVWCATASAAATAGTFVMHVQLEERLQGLAACAEERRPDDAGTDVVAKSRR
jgi:hypothetical protein